MTDQLLPQSLSAKHERLCEFFKGMEQPLAIAFSGGVDSTFLLACAIIHCRFPVVALHASSPFVHHAERQRIESVANSLGATLLNVRWDPFDHEDIIRNGKRRCYFCKSVMYRHLIDHAASIDISILMDGTQADDMKSERPGLRAISELGIITPLAQFSLDKHDIRHLSYLQTLETWELASQSCLATRIETGRYINVAELQLVDRVEQMIASKGISGSRFRIGERKARLYIPDANRTDLEALLQSVRTTLAEYGFGSLEIVPEI